MASTLTPPEKETKSPRERLKELEEEVIILGMDPQALEKIQMIGECPQQIRQRIRELEKWRRKRLAAI